MSGTVLSTGNIMVNNMVIALESGALDSHKAHKFHPHMIPSVLFTYMLNSKLGVLLRHSWISCLAHGMFMNEYLQNDWMNEWSSYVLLFLEGAYYFSGCIHCSSNSLSCPVF